MGYSESSKAYKVYIPSHQRIETSRDVTFDEDTIFNRSRQRHTNEVHDEDPAAPRIANVEGGKNVVPEECDPEDHDMAEPQRPEGPPQENTKKRRPAWAHEIIQDAEKYGDPDRTFRESKKPKPYSSYLAWLSAIIDAEPTCYEEAADKKEWKDSMIEEYQSIIKNDVWDVVPRPRDKSVVSSKWIYKIKHSVYGSIEKYKARLVARGFSQK
jgi:hypothetical protein